MQYLDVLKDIKKISDANINASLKRMKRLISELTSDEKKRLIDLAVSYYTAQARALTGMLLRP